MKNEVFLLLKQHNAKDDEAVDWLIRSWDLKGEDRDIARLMYGKLKKEAHKYTKEMLKLCEN